MNAKEMGEFIAKTRKENQITQVELANYQRKKALRRIIIGGAAFLIGICTIVYAIKLYITQTWSLMIGGNDGSTSVFVAGKIGNLPIVIIFIIGMFVLICGIITMLRSKK